MLSADLAIYLSKQMLWKAIVITSPIIGLALIIGLIVSILQVITQIQDSTLSTVPKIITAMLALIFCSGWMLRILTDYASSLLINIPELLR